MVDDLAIHYNSTRVCRIPYGILRLDCTHSNTIRYPLSIDKAALTGYSLRVIIATQPIPLYHLPPSQSTSFNHMRMKSVNFTLTRRACAVTHFLTANSCVWPRRRGHSRSQAILGGLRTFLIFRVGRLPWTVELKGLC